jgi:hypothetical protein
MGFAQPLALWLLVLLPLVALIHQLRARSAVVVVPSLMLWKGMPETVRAESFSRRWRPNALLILQLFALGCAVIALSEPYIQTAVGIPSRVVFVLDISASMKATDVTPSRFAAARSRILSDANRLPKRTRFALVIAGSRPAIRLGFSTSRRELRRALDSARPTDESANLSAAIAFANALADGVDVRLYTDTTIEGFESTTRLFRKRPKDIALTELIVSAEAGNPSDASARVTVENHAGTPQRIRLSLDVDGAPTDAQSVDVGANASASATFRFRADGRRPTSVVVTVESDDDYDANNRIYRVLTATRPLRVLVVGEASPFLDALLSVNPGVTLRHVSADAYLESDDDDLTVFYRAVPAALPRGYSVFIAPSGDLPFARRLEPVPTGAVTWDASHPLMRFCDFAAWSLRRATRFETTSLTRTLVSSGRLALVALSESAASRSLLLAFDAFNPNETDFPLRPLAVVFFTNLVAWAEASRRVAPESIVAGDVVRWGGRDDEPDAVELPNGTRVLTGSAFDRTEDSGVYRLFAGERLLGAFAVNSAPNERPDVDAPVKPPSVPGRTLDRQHRREVWQAFALTALILLLVEWWVFHRR